MIRMYKFTFFAIWKYPQFLSGNLDQQNDMQEQGWLLQGCGAGTAAE